MATGLADDRRTNRRKHPDGDVTVLLDEPRPPWRKEVRRLGEITGCSHLMRAPRSQQVST